MRQRAPALKPIDQAALQTMVETTAKKLLIPGAVVLLRTPQGEFTVTYGTTLLGAISPPRAETHFRIASNTKTMTAAVIVLLAQEGKLSLDDPVSKYVPGVPNGDNITITELLNMRSGLYTPQSSGRSSTVIRLRSGPQPKCWRSRQSTRPTSHPVRTSTTPTPTTHCLALLQKRWTGSRWPVVSKTVCSDRWA
jgi:CubicO group peptidase (beta-lactamase class C family)